MKSKTIINMRRHQHNNHGKGTLRNTRRPNLVLINNSGFPLQCWKRNLKNQISFDVFNIQFELQQGLGFTFMLGYKIPEQLDILLISIWSLVLIAKTFFTPIMTWNWKFLLNFDTYILSFSHYCSVLTQLKIQGLVESLANCCIFQWL